MALLPSKSHLPIIFLFILLHLAQAKLNLDRSDYDALVIIQKDLGFASQRYSLESSCNTAGVFCERRLSNDSYVLKITRLVFKSEDLKGHLSSSIGKLSELKELTISDNEIAGEIPYQLANCRKLEVLNLRKNRFSGQVPMELSSLIRLRVLDLSANKFSGGLMFLKNFPSLESLSLADNMFSGEVPASVKRFRSLRFVDFSGDSLIEDYSSKKLARKDIIPKRFIFAESKNQTSAIGKSMPPAKAPSASVESNGTSAQAPSPAAPTTKKHKKKRNVGGWILVFLAGIVAGSLCGLIFSVLFKLLVYFIRGGDKDTSLAIFSPEIKKAEDLAFLYKEDGLASFEVIGRGGCGEVYRAELGNGKTVAIKKIIQPSRDSRDAAELSEEDSKFLNKQMRQIKSEIKIVGQIRHRNLLPVLAHLARPECHYLVYEYMKNGSLQDILQEVTEGKRELDWLARHRIALGIAAGLEYLHINHTPRVIHRDLKPANVLLDDDMEARITDFGLAKAMPEMFTHVTTSNVAGTVGYIAPEYHQTLKFTDKCDIYSFGVLLGSLVIGKLPSDDFFQHTPEMSLVKWMRNIMTSEDPKSAIDSRLLGNGYEEQMLLVLKIACFCTLDNPKERPNSKDVRLMLSQIKH